MRTEKVELPVVPLPWSDGVLTARLWQVGEKTVVGVPELGLHSVGKSQAEAAFRLFTTLLKYYRQLNNFKYRLSDKALKHLDLLAHWVNGIEKKMTLHEVSNESLASASSRVVKIIQ